MVVIVILGLLASLTIPSLMSNKNRADQQKAVSDISALENALDMYRLDNGDYPTEQQGIAALVTKPNVPPITAEISIRWLYPAFTNRSMGGILTK